MDKSFQKEILERRNTMLFKKELSSINPKHTIKPKRAVTDSEYLIVGPEKNINKYNDGRNNLLNEINSLNKTRETNIELDILNKNQPKLNNEKQVIIDLSENTKNTITNKNLICLGIFLLASYIGITIINDYLIINHL